MMIYFNNVLIDNDAVAGLTNDYKIYVDNFYLGGVASNTFKLTCGKQFINNHPSEIVINDGTTSFHLQVDKITEDKSFYYYDLVDAMVNFDFQYDAKPLIDSNKNNEIDTHLSDILQDICLQANIECQYVLTTTDYVVNWWDNRITARDYISMIAEKEGCFARINDNGELDFIPVNSPSKMTISEEYVSELFIGERKEITRVVYDNGVNKWEFGDDTGNTLYLNPNNVYILDASDVEQIYNKINGFTFYSITVSDAPIDSAIRAGDIITFKDVDNNLYPTIAQYSTSYGGGWIGGYSFDIKTDKQQETNIIGLFDSIKSIRTEIDRTNAELKITAEKITDLTDFTKNITNQGDLIELPNTPKSNGAIRELIIKNFQLLELYPGMTYPSNFVYPGVLNFYMLVFDNVDTFDNNPHYVYIQSPIPLQSVISEGQTYHNELVIEENKVKIIENIKWNFETEEYEVVPIPTIHELPTVVLPTFEVDTYIKVDYFEDLIFDAEYLIKNDFTDTFATQTESSSQFTINSEEIATKVSKDNIISEINQSAEEIKINADKITLQGNQEFSSIISGINNQLEDIQDQIDGKVSTYYGTDAPTLYNYPADEWITEEDRNNHLGDLYYDGDSKAYRFSYIDDEYVWKEIADSDVQAIYEELNSRITQTASEINLEVAKKTNKTEIISTINQSAEAVTINANKISLAGKIINLTSDNITIDSTNFKVTKAGVVTANSLKATNVDLSGKITATSGSFTGSITSSSGSVGGWTISTTDLRYGGIDGSNGARLYRDGRLYMKNDYGWLNTGTGGTILSGNGSTYPVVISDNFSTTTGGGTIGIRALFGNIRIASNYAVRISGSSIDLGGSNITSLASYSLAGHTFSGGGGARMYANANCMLDPADGYGAYINTTAAGNRIAVSSSGPSSRNVKENLKELKYDGIYNDLQKLKTYSFDYKYTGIKDDKSDFGFIIDEIEELPTISKFAKHYDVEGYIKDGKLIRKRDDDEEQKNMTPFKYKEWDRDSYIKMLLLFIKSLQEKVDDLEEVIYGQAN